MIEQNMIRIYLVNILIFMFGALYGKLLYMYKLSLENKKDKNGKKIYFGLLDFIPFLSLLNYKKRNMQIKRYGIKSTLNCIISGVVFVILYNSFNIFLLKQRPKLTQIQIYNEMALLPLTLAFMYLVSAIDKDKNYINKKVLMGGIVLSFSKIFVMTMFVNIYQDTTRAVLVSVAYYCILILVILSQINGVRAKKEESYFKDLLALTIILTMIFNIEIMFLAIIATTLGTIIAESTKTLFENKVKFPLYKKITPMYMTFVLISYFLFNIYIYY